MSDAEFALDLSAFDQTGESGPAGMMGNFDVSMPAGNPSSAGAGFNWGDALKGLGTAAKIGVPALTAGAGIFGAVNNLKAQEQAGKQSQLQSQALRQQMQGAQTAQALSPEIAATARQINPLAQGVESKITGPVLDFATTRLKGAQAGEIPPAVEAQFQQAEQAERAQLLDYLARSGQGDSSARVTMESALRQKYQAKRADYLRQSEQDALGAFKQAEGSTTTTGNLYGAEGAGLGTAANAATAGAGAASGVSAQAQQDQRMLLELIASTNKALEAMTAGAA